MTPRLPYALLLALFSVAPNARAQCVPGEATLSDTTRILASDRFGGRAPGSAQEPLVLDYIKKAFQTAGLTPAGDMVDGTRQWTQRVSLVRSRIAGPVEAALRTGAKAETLHQGEEIAVRAARPGIGQVDISAAPIVFVGYGVSAPEQQWDDFKGIDLKGKIALILVNDPDYEAVDGPFGGKAMTYYGRWTYKLEEATRQGALGALLIHEKKAASYGWSTVRNSMLATVFDIPAAEGAHQLKMTGWVQHDVAARLLALAGLQLETLEKQATRRDFRPVELSHVSLKVRFRTEHENTVSHNVLGMLPGRQHPDQYLIYSAHWDHIGQRKGPDGQTHIYNGAVDNAVGVAALLELAKCFGSNAAGTAAEAPDRSIIFLATTAEEQGMLGSGYYVANPLYPLRSTIGLINMDTLGTYGVSRNVSSFGHAANSLTDALRTAAHRQGRVLTPDPDPEAGHFYRSETLPFARAGVPAITFASGEDLLDGGTTAGRQRMADYITRRYHQPDDIWTDDMRFDGIAKDVSLLYEMGYRLANERNRPFWYKESEFGNGPR